VTPFKISNPDWSSRACCRQAPLPEWRPIKSKPLNIKSKPLYIKSKPLNIKSKPLNIKSKPLNIKSKSFYSTCLLQPDPSLVANNNSPWEFPASWHVSGLCGPLHGMCRPSAALP
jgi:hypothetical protein